MLRYAPALLLALLPGCGVVESTVDLPAQAIRAVTPETRKPRGADPAELQSTVIRLSDSLLYRVARDLDKLRREGRSLPRKEGLALKIRLVTELVSISSGPNAVANLLDLTVFVGLLRSAAEKHWKPAVFGDSADPALQSCRRVEAELWEMVSAVLTPEQIAELKQAIEGWQKDHPNPAELPVARAVGFDSPTDGSGPSTSLFKLLRLDPLAGLDPATQEIARTRAFAERALYVAQKMPMLLRWQSELLLLDLADSPSLKQAAEGAAQIGASSDRLAKVAEQLPDRVTKEREAVVAAFREQEKEIAAVLSSGTQMSTSLHATITAFDALMKRFGVGEPDRPKSSAEPFRINDYAAAAAQLDATAKQLTELVKALDHTAASLDATKLSAQIAPAVQRAEAGGKDLIDHAFRRALILVGIVFAAALLYRILAPRLPRGGRLPRS